MSTPDLRSMILLALRRIPMNKQVRISAIDADVILQHLLDDNEELFAKARDIMHNVEGEKLHVACDPVNLAEIIWY